MLWDALSSACMRAPQDRQTNVACDWAVAPVEVTALGVSLTVYAGATYTSGTPARFASYLTNEASWSNSTSAVGPAGPYGAVPGFGYP